MNGWLCYGSRVIEKDFNKLKLNKGDIKATQGDTGHSQIDMITDVYAHILDEDRKINAQRFESAFYSNCDLRKVHVAEEKETSPDVNNLVSLLENSPELTSMLSELVRKAASCSN